MGTDVTLHLRGGASVTVHFEDTWELKDSEHLVLLLDHDRRPRGGANLATFSHFTVAGDQDGDGE